MHGENKIQYMNESVGVIPVHACALLEFHDLSCRYVRVEQPC